MNRIRATLGASLLLINLVAQTLMASSDIFVIPDNAEQVISSSDNYQGGISLGGSLSTARFEGIFPVGGDIALNGGTLSLERDLHCASHTHITSGGLIQGNHNHLILPYSTEELSLPSGQSYADLLGTEFITTGQRVGASAWSPVREDGGDLIGLGSYYQADSIFTVGKYTQNGFLSQSMVSLPAGVRGLAWDMHAHSGVLGLESYAGESTPCTLFQFIYHKQTQTITLRPINSRSESVSVVRVSPDGNYCAVAYYTADNQVEIYQKDAAMGWSLVDSITVPVAGNALYDIAWSADGSYLALGGSYAQNIPQIIIYRWGNNHLTHIAQLSVPAHISSLVWNGEDTVYAGLVGGGDTKRLRQYSLVPEDHVIREVGGYDLSLNVYDLEWNKDRNLLAISINNDEKEGEVLVYQKQGDSLVRCSATPNEKSFYMLSWAPSENILSAIDSFAHIGFYTIDSALKLTNIGLVCNSPVSCTLPLFIHGHVGIHGNNNRIKLDAIDPFYIKENSELLCKNSNIYSEHELIISGHRSGVLKLENSKLKAPRLTSTVPIMVIGNISLEGDITAPIFLPNGTEVTLTGHTKLAGNIISEGTVKILCNGYNLDLSSLQLGVKNNSELLLKQGVINFPENGSQCTLEGAESKISCEQSEIKLTNDILLPHGAISCSSGSVIEREGEVISCRRFAYHGGGNNSLWNLARAHGELQDLSSATHEQNTIPAQEQPREIIINTESYTLNKNLVCDHNHTIRVVRNTVIQGNHNLLLFGIQKVPTFFINPGVTVTFSNILVQNLRPEHISHGANARLVWGDKTDIVLASQGQLDNTWYCGGAVSISGSGSRFIFGESGALLIGDGSRVTLEGISCGGLYAHTFVMQTDLSELIFSDTHVDLVGDLLLPTGKISYKNRNSIGGAHTVHYTSRGQIKILEKSALRIERGVQFYYNPQDQGIYADRQFICEPSGSLEIAGAGLRSGVSGLTFRTGTFIFENNVTLDGREGEVSFGVRPGSDNSGHDQIKIAPRPGTRFQVYGNVYFADTE